MTNFFTAENIIASIAVVSIIFNTFQYFSRPQQVSDKREGILALEIKQLKEDIVNLRDNHIHSLEIAIKDTNTNLNLLTNQVGKLATVIDERVPRIV